MACRISVPQPGVNPGPWQWKLRVLTTGSLGHLQDSPFWRLRYLQIDRWVQQSFVISLDSGGEQKTLKVWSWLLFCPHYPFFFFFPWANHQSAFYYPHFTEEETGSEILDHFQGTHSWYLAELEFEFISNKIQFLKHYFIFQKAVTVRMKRREKTSKTFLRGISRKQLLRGGIKRKAKDKLESHYATWLKTFKDRTDILNKQKLSLSGMSITLTFVFL